MCSFCRGVEACFKKKERKKLMPSTFLLLLGRGKKEQREMEIRPFTRQQPLLAYFPVASEARWAGRGGADGDAPVRRKALWEARAASEVVGGEVGAAVCFLVGSNSRVLFLPRGERRGGETAATAAGAAVASDTVLCLFRRMVPLPPPSHCLLCLCCVKAGARPRAAP